MTGERWSDRVVTEPCRLCGRRGFGVKAGIACWPDGECQAMWRCWDDRELCRALAEENGIPWPSGLVEPKLLPARAGATTSAAVTGGSSAAAQGSPALLPPDMDGPDTAEPFPVSAATGAGEGSADPIEVPW